MAVYVAFLRAINVAGTGKLAMSDLNALCQAAGFQAVKTYIQSGNVAFKSRLGKAKVRTTLQTALATKMGKPSAVHVRTASELEDIESRNPFPKAPPNRVLVLFLDKAPPRHALDDVKIPGREQVEISGHEVFVHYPDGMGRSKLKLPFAQTGTGRNLNTLNKMIALARAIAE